MASKYYTEPYPALRPSSPPLPTFAIKDLLHPSDNPRLISISKSRYDGTLQRAPDAALLYLDDDDGELITIGSSFELSQRLDEPVPKYIREFRDPADGKLIHVFDINRSESSRLQWRYLACHSSMVMKKKALSESGTMPGYYADSTFNLSSDSPQITYPQLPESHEQDEPTNPSTISELSPLPQPVQLVEKGESKTVDAFNLLDGIEEHLSGLANVLQIAATTLQKAADKTRESDTTVIEDILVGVKGILTEVGSFGVEAFKELGGEIKSADDELSERPVVSNETKLRRVEEKLAALQLAREAKREFEKRNNHKESQSSEESPVPVGLGPVASKVKFDLPTEDFSSRPESALSARLGEVSEIVKVSPLDKILPAKPNSSSFLDDSSEDAEFTARFPPLSTVRRSCSILDRSSKLSFEETYDESIVSGKGKSEDRTEHAETNMKSLPGAWPEIKNDSVPTLPTSNESSGDFFNRMIGQGYSKTSRNPGFGSTLHRSNTTASSNPASRLNGPFDPGLPYDTSSAHHKPCFARGHRSLRRSASPPRNWCDKFEAMRARHDPQRIHKIDSSPPYPESNPRYGVANPTSKFESHRAVRHHRSVPHFPPPPPPRPYRMAAPKVGPSEQYTPPSKSTTDFLTGPPMPMPPPMPFTTRPQFMPRSTPPNLWAPWQSSPPTQAPTGGSCVTRSVVGPSDSPKAINEPFDFPDNTPPFPSAQPQARSISPVSSYRYPSPAPARVHSSRLSSLPPVEPAQVEPIRDKIDECVEQLKICGFGIDDDNLKDRLHVYAVAADGDVMEAVEMIEQDRKMTAPGRFE